jgi:type III restriction enzyme
VAQSGCEAPAHVLFPQIVRIDERYLNENERQIKPANILDVFLSPYFGLVIKRMLEAVKHDNTQGEAPKVPRYETNRRPGSTADVDYWTSKDVREVINSHMNYAVADTMVWEQSDAYVIDTHPKVDAFVKNAGLGFVIPYSHNGQS